MPTKIISKTMLECLIPAQFGPQFFNKIYIFTKDIRNRYEASDRFNSYLKQNHIPVYISEFKEVNPFASTGGIKYMENRVDEYLKTHIKSELNKIISEASENQKKIQQVRYDSERGDKIRRDLSNILGGQMQTL